MTTAPRPIVFGEVLFDIFPDRSEVLGGAPFNVAWHLHAFGLKPLFISRVGDDALGHAIREAMQDWGMDTSGLQIDGAYPTGTVRIDLEDGEPVFNIVAEQAYDRISADSLPSLDTGGLLYHGSLALRDEPSRRTLGHIRECPSLKPFIDVNLRDPWWEKEEVLGALEGAAWVKINGHELAQLVPESKERQEQARILQERFALEALFVTEGAAGAFARTPEGDTLRVAPTEAVRIVDAVGAGDAFASVLVVGILGDWPLQLSLQRAQTFASAIVGQRGATVRDPAFYQGFVTSWGL
jgi:fructokinase